MATPAVIDGSNFIGGTSVRGGAKPYRGVDPASGQTIEPVFNDATAAEVDRALVQAEAAFPAYRAQPPAKIAAFLEAMAAAIDGLGDDLLKRANQETALPMPRLTGERARTTNQLKMFAALVRDGSWVEATIDHGDPARKPAAKPDLRRMLFPLGPVVMFGASNFPFAFSAAGGDTAAALAAGNPVVVKAHPAHPGTSELTARAVLAAAEACGMPKGVFSLVHGADVDVGLALVRHPLTQAVAFTGSLRGGRALFDAAAARPRPIPVFAEMGSINPVFILPGAIAERGPALAEGLVNSLTLGVGQFCTNPGLVVVKADDAFTALLAQRVAAAPQGTMLHAAIARAYADGLAQQSARPGVRPLARGQGDGRASCAGVASIAVTDAARFLADSQLAHEVFGPSTLVVACASDAEMLKVAGALDGQLTATIHAAAAEHAQAGMLAEILLTKVGRLVYNGFPTGVEPCAAMQHGGPYPSTTDSRSTSVGTYSIKRFCRPVCYQDAPPALLPAALRDGNPLGLLRQVDGKWLVE